jgi:hypothetical protein
MNTSHMQCLHGQAWRSIRVRRGVVVPDFSPGRHRPKWTLNRARSGDSGGDQMRPGTFAKWEVQCVCCERVPRLLPFVFVGVGPYVIWETTESADEEFDLKLPNSSCLIPSVHNAGLWNTWLKCSTQKKSAQLTGICNNLFFLKKTWHGRGSPMQ